MAGPRKAIVPRRPDVRWKSQADFADIPPRGCTMAEENDPQNHFERLLETLPPGEKSKFIESFLKMFKPVVESAVNKSLSSAFNESLQKLGYTGDVAGLVHLLAARSNDTKESVLQKALTLYGLALDAR